MMPLGSRCDFGHEKHQKMWIGVLVLSAKIFLPINAIMAAPRGTTTVVDSLEETGSYSSWISKAGGFTRQS